VGNMISVAIMEKVFVQFCNSKTIII
jgi:hypothetical protein